MKVNFLVVTVLLIGGCMTQSKKATGKTDEAMVPTDVRIAGAAPIILGSSVRGAPIGLYRFGNGANPVLILAAIHGNETSTLAISRGLIELLQKEPVVAQRQ